MKFLKFICVASLGIGLYLQHPKFGRKIRGKRKELIEASSNFNGEKFKNIVEKPIFSDDADLKDALLEYFFNRNEKVIPKEVLPIIKTDLSNLDDNTLVWFGHSAYMLRIDGVNYLIDPVLEGNASPIPGNIEAFKGTEYYNSSKIPNIDYLIITHDHYDHLDYQTIKLIKDKVAKVIVPLGVGEHFEYWGYPVDKIIELDWNESAELDNNITITSVTTHHSSGRLKQNTTLWSSYVLKTFSEKIFLGGDGSYGAHFKNIGDNYGPFDLAILENGQYNKNWRYSHMFPEETLKAAQDLNSKRMLPIHNCKFTLSNHDWNEPLISLTTINDKEYNQNILTPKIGEVVYFNKENTTSRWFEDLE